MTESTLRASGFYISDGLPESSVEEYGCLELATFFCGKVWEQRWRRIVMEVEDK